MVGRRTFGKGLVQQPIKLNDGSELRLTISRYYTPSGRSIQKHYELGKGEDYNKDLRERLDSGEYFSADSIKFDPKLRYQTDGGRGGLWRRRHHARHLRAARHEHEQQVFV